MGGNSKKKCRWSLSLKDKKIHRMPEINTDTLATPILIKIEDQHLDTCSDRPLLDLKNNQENVEENVKKKCRRGLSLKSHTECEKLIQIHLQLRF